MAIQIRVAKNEDERQAIYRFRYQIYIQEMGRNQRYADHARTEIQEPLDATATNIFASINNEVIGCIRFNSGQDTDFGEYVESYAMRLAGPFFPQNCSITTKFMVAPEYRRSTLPMQLCVKCYFLGVSCGTFFDFIDCNPHLEAIFANYGYRAYRGRIQHPEYGDVLPMVLAALDHKHLESLRSPFAPIATRFAPHAESLRHFYKCILPQE